MEYRQQIHKKKRESEQLHFSSFLVAQISVQQFSRILHFAIFVHTPISFSTAALWMKLAETKISSPHTIQYVIYVLELAKCR